MPHDLTAERAVLAVMLMRPSCIPATIEALPPSAFYSERHRRIYEAIVAVQQAHGDKTDPILVRNRLETTDALEDSGGIPYMLGMLDGVARSASVDSYVKVVLEHAQQRDALNAATVMQSLVTEPGGVEEAVSYVRGWADLAERNRSQEAPKRIQMATVLDGTDPPIPWIIDGWLAEGEIAQFAGEWATGKSYIALDLAISLAAGIPWLGVIPVKQCPVLYVDEENTEHTARRRIRRMLRGRGLQPEQLASLPLTYLHRNGLNLSSRGGLATLRIEIEQAKAQVAILDSLFDLICRDMNRNDLVIEFYAGLKRLSSQTRCAFDVLDHMKKPSKEDEQSDPAHRIIGASMKSNIVDETWTLSGDRHKDTRQLSASKARAGDRLAPTLTTRYEESEDGSACWISASPTEQLSRAVVVGIAASSGAPGIYAAELLAAIQERMGVSKTTALRVVAAATKDGDLIRQSVGTRVLYQARNGSV